MKSILFRGKRIDNGEWVEGYYIYHKNADNGEIYWESDPDHLGYYTDDIYSVDLATVSQYTGLTDKNGKKIFEGDIVKTKYGRLCKVIYFISDCACCIDLIPINSKHRAPTAEDIFSSDNLEVVGNIHDNPELFGNFE